MDNPKLNWIQSDFIPNMPIYYVEVPEYENAEAVCLRIEYSFEDKFWYIDVCQTVRLKGEFTFHQVNECKIEAETQLTNYLQTITKLYEQS